MYVCVYVCIYDIYGRIPLTQHPQDQIDARLSCNTHSDLSFYM